MGVTSDPTDPRLTRGVDDEPTPMAEVYLVLSDEERAKGFTRPYRDAYRHVGRPDHPDEGCGSITTMGRTIAETYARDPRFYGATFCVRCQKHLAVGADGQFIWYEMNGSDGPRVGT